MACLLCNYDENKPKKGDHLRAVGESEYVCTECATRAKTVTNFGLTVEELKFAAEQFKKSLEFLGVIMADKLFDIYDEWRAKQNAPDAFQCFQAGFSASAVSMRERAMKVVDGKEGVVPINLNDIKNSIGQLSDIPE